MDFRQNHNSPFFAELLISSHPRNSKFIAKAPLVFDELAKIFQGPWTLNDGPLSIAFVDIAIEILVDRILARTHFRWLRSMAGADIIPVYLRYFELC